MSFNGMDTPASGSRSGLALLSAAPLLAAEALVALGLPLAGFAVDSLALLLLLISAVLEWRRPVHFLLLGLTLIPLMRLFSLALSPAALPAPVQVLAAGVPLLAAAIACSRSLRFSLSYLGVALRQPVLQALLALNGLALAYVQFRLVAPGSWIAAAIPRTTPGQVALSAVALLFAAAVEEFVFRGVLQQAAIRFLGSSGIVYVAGLAAMLYVGYRSIWAVPLALGISLYFGWAADNTGSLWGVIIAHGLINIIALLVLPAVLLPF